MDTEILMKKSEYRDTKILVKKSEYREAEIGNNNLKIDYYQQSNLNFSVSGNRQYSANTRVENVDLIWTSNFQGARKENNNAKFRGNRNKVQKYGQEN